VLKDTFVSGFSGLVGLAVHAVWFRSLQLCTRFSLQAHTFGRCFAFPKSFVVCLRKLRQYPLQTVLFKLV